MERTFDENGTVELGMKLNTTMKLEEDPVEQAMRGSEISSLPEELIMAIVSSLIVQELRPLRAVAKFKPESHLIDRISQRLQELKSVCQKWNSILSNSPRFLQRKILGALGCLDMKPFVIRTFHFLMTAFNIAKLRDKIYATESDSMRSDHKVRIHVFREDFSFETSGPVLDLSISTTDATTNPKTFSFVACHGFLYILMYAGIWKISPDEDFKHELWLNRKSLGLEDDTRHQVMSVSKDDNLLIFNPHKLMIAIYGSSGDILRSIKIQDCLGPLGRFESLSGISEKRNGNLTFWMIRYGVVDTAEEIMEFSSDGRLLRQLDLPCHVYCGRSLLDSSDQLISVDRLRQQLYVFDSDLLCHSVSLDGCCILPTDIVCDFHYDEPQNILYLALYV